MCFELALFLRHDYSAYVYELTLETNYRLTGKVIDVSASDLDETLLCYRAQKNMRHVIFFLPINIFFQILRKKIKIAVKFCSLLYSLIFSIGFI